MTDLPHLASRLYGTPLMIARPKLAVILDVFARRLAGEMLSTPSITPDGSKSGGLQILDGIAVLPVLGTLVRRSSYLHAASGLMSYHAIEEMAEVAFADPGVRAVLLEVDSSGGEVGGVFDLAERLRELSRASGKPLWAIADEAALSAAYAIASAADRIWLTRTAEVGSIGVVAVHVDQSRADAQAGLAYTFIFAGTHKIDGHSHAPLPPDVMADLQADVDRLYEQFVELVARHRRLSSEAVRATDARIYRGEAAIVVGLADQIGTREQVITAMRRALQRPVAIRVSSQMFSPQLLKESSMMETEPMADDTALSSPVMSESLAALPDEAAIAAQVEQRLRAQLAELTEIAAQAKRLGVIVDPAQALAQGITPDALRRQVLTEAAERDRAADIVAHVTRLTSAESPLVKAAKAYGGQ